MTGEIDPLFANHPEVVERKAQTETFVKNLKRAFAENDIPGPFREPTDDEVSVAILEFNRGTQAEGCHNGEPAMRRALRAVLNKPVELQALQLDRDAHFARAERAVGILNALVSWCENRDWGSQEELIEWINTKAALGIERLPR